MNVSKYQNLTPGVLRQALQSLSRTKGSVLVYLIVVILIFGVLGVTMVSLFTSAATSSATPNDARRAYFVAESGVRYALSRIRNANFHQDFIEDLNQTTAYTLDDGSSFTINVFSPWFISTTGQNTSTHNPFALAVPNEGKIPEGFSIPDTNVFLVDWQNFRTGTDTSYAGITDSSTPAEAKSLTITLGDNLVISADDIASLAVKCDNNGHTIRKMPDSNSYLYIAEEAKDFFPSRYGAIRILKTDDS
jgi:hypothetical protein